jgi:hypothetical protein
VRSPSPGASDTPPTPSVTYGTVLISKEDKLAEMARRKEERRQVRHL